MGSDWAKLVGVAVLIEIGFAGIVTAQEEDPFAPDPTKVQPEESRPGSAMETAVFIVPQSAFIERNTSSAADPFAAPEESRTRGFKNPVEVLESAGIEFPPGSSAVYNAGSSLLTVTNSPDQLELVYAYLGTGHNHIDFTQILVLVEFIEVEDSLYHGWTFANRFTVDATPLRRKAQEWLKSGEGTLLETTVVMARSGMRAKVESVHEIIYPTEGDPPEIPNDLSLEGKNTQSPITASTSTAFETRNVGVTLEVDPVLGADDFTMDFNLAPELIVQDDYTHWPPEADDEFFTISHPKFHKMKISTQLPLQDGQYGFLGTTRPAEAAVDSRERPIVLVFLRADISRPGPLENNSVSQIR